MWESDSMPNSLEEVVKLAAFKLYLYWPYGSLLHKKKNNNVEMMIYTYLFTVP